MMNFAFNPKTCTWEIGWPGRVAKHDVVYLSPPGDPMQGLPIGNGDVGVLCWCEDSRLIMAVNKCDLWDDAEFGRFHNWQADEEEHSTTLRHAGRIIIDFKLPVFDILYLSDFRGRLSLADATLSLAAAGPLGSISFKAFVGHDDGTICCELESNFKENIPLEISVERYGSRTFPHWCSLVDRDPSIGLGGTRASADKDGAYVTHKLTGGRFALGLNVTDKGGLTTRYLREHSHRAGVAVSGKLRKKCVVMATVTDCLPDDPMKAAKDKLKAAKKAGTAKLFTSHKKAWKAFWLQSLMESGDDYLDNLWHLAMFYANASQRGKYPGRFINALWGWNRDFQAWNFYFHWNQQQIYWPLNAAGHHELLDSYLDYRFNSLPHAKEDARDIFGVDGAVVSDVCERRGYNSVCEFLNHTPVAQIAMDFWRQYKFTGDADFLKNRVIPYLLEAAKFFESRLEKGKDGKYHAKEGTGYEGCIRLKDAISELVCARVLFSTAIEALREAAVDEPRAKKWKDILDNLAPLPVIKGREGFLVEANGSLKLGRGIFKGDATDSDEIFAAGLGVKEGRMLTSFLPADEPPTGLVDLCEIIKALESNPPASPINRPLGDLKCNDGIFPWVEFSTVFPSGLIGLSQGDSPLFKAAVNTAKLFGICGMGFDPTPIVLARLGLSREVSETLKLWPGRWQFFCNGLGREGPREFVRPDLALRFRTNTVQDASLPREERTGHEFRFPAWPFRHIGMEPMAVLSAAMNEALLQSHDGIIRVAPAATKDQRARFTLHAQDGFIVSAEIQDGKPLWIALKSKFGNTCKLANPWPKAFVYANGENIGCPDQNLIEFPTSRNETYLVVPDEKTAKEWNTNPVKYQQNEKPKIHSSGGASLGLPRMF